MRKHLYALLAVVCVLLAIASSTTVFASDNSSAPEDWSMFRHDAAHTGYSTVAGPSKPNVLWSFQTSGNPVDSSPAIVDGKLYVGSNNGNIYCLDAKTGRQVWLNFKIDSWISSSPAVVNGSLYISGDSFYCIDAQTGNVSWTFPMGGGGASSPAIANGYVYVDSAGETLYCLNALTGQEVWNFSVSSLEPEIDPTYHYFAEAVTSPAVAGERVYIGGTNLYCLTADSGELIWSYPTVVACSPTVSEGKVFFSSVEGDAYCLDAATGNKLWNRSNITLGWTRSGPTVTDGRVYFGGLIYCLNANNGDTIWRYSIGDVYALSSPIVAGKYAYFCAGFGSNNGDTAYCVNAATGEFVWKHDASFSNSLAVVDGVLYVGGSDSVVAFSDSWKIPMPVLVMVLTVVSTCLVVVLAYVANREGTAPSAKWKKVFTVPVTSVLIVIILVSSFASLCITNFTPSHEEPSFPPACSLLWQIEIENTASSIAVAYGKVFITVGWAEAYAYNAQDGQFIWNWSGGYSYYYGGHVVKAYQGSVYVNHAGVYRLNETNGKVIQYYKAPPYDYNKGKPSFTLGDGKVFVEKDGLAAYDVDSGGLYWQIDDLSPWDEAWFDGVHLPVTLGELGRTYKTNRLSYIYIFRDARLDVNTGETLWGSPLTRRYGPSMVVNDRVVFWNFWNSSNQPNIIHCVDALVGRTLWDFDLGTPVYEPIVYGDLLVFGASDGYLYALNLDDGSLAWKTLVDVDGWIGGHNLPVEAKSLSDPSAPSIVVDDKTGVGYWGFLVTERQIKGINGDNLYAGVFCSFDLSTGNISRTTVVKNSCTLNDNEVILAPSQSALFLRTGLDLWTIDRAAFNPTQIQHLENPIVGPVSSDGKVYIVSNLHLSAYK